MSSSDLHGCCGQFSSMNTAFISKQSLIPACNCRLSSRHRWRSHTLRYPCAPDLPRPPVLSLARRCAGSEPGCALRELPHHGSPGRHQWRSAHGGGCGGCRSRQGNGDDLCVDGRTRLPAARGDRILPPGSAGISRMAGYARQSSGREGFPARSACRARRCLDQRPLPRQRQAPVRHPPHLRSVCAAPAVAAGDRPGRSLPGRAVHSRSLRCARCQGAGSDPLVIADGGHRTTTQRDRQDLGRDRLRRPGCLDTRRHPPVRRAHDRYVRLGPRDLGQRQPGVHAGRTSGNLGGSDPRAARCLFGG